MSYLIDAFHAALGLEKESKKDFATRNQIDPSRISMFINGRFPSDSLLKILVNSWSKPEIRKMMMIARLKDEILRADQSVADYAIHESDNSGDPELHRALSILDAVVSKEKELRDNLIELANMVSSQAPQKMAAEAPGNYTKKSHSKQKKHKSSRN